MSDTGPLSTHGFLATVAGGSGAAGWGRAIARGRMLFGFLRACVRAFAPLAQSAERFHGKEKVESSILSGSSILGVDPVQGDVAQLVRALDS